MTEKIQRNFWLLGFWKGVIDHLIRWEVCKTKRFPKDHNSFWHANIRSNYWQNMGV